MLLGSENAKKVPTASLVITFGTLTVLQHIHARYQWLVIRAYFVNPRHCFKCLWFQFKCCQGFRYVSSNFTKPELCNQCGLKGTTVKSEEMTPNVEFVVAIILHVPSIVLDTNRKRLFCLTKDKISFNDARKLYRISKPVILRKSFLLQLQLQIK